MASYIKWAAFWLHHCSKNLYILRKCISVLTMNSNKGQKRRQCEVCRICSILYWLFFTWMNVSLKSCLEKYSLFKLPIYSNPSLYDIYRTFALYISLYQPDFVKTVENPFYYASIKNFINFPISSISLEKTKRGN